jgi:hypothetical protein
MGGSNEGKSIRKSAQNVLDNSGLSGRGPTYTLNGSSQVEEKRLEMLMAHYNPPEECIKD